MSRAKRLVLALVPLALPACATVKTPTLSVEALKVGKVGITGVTMDVGFKVRNPNPEPLVIERFEYELFLNGNRLGRGYQPDALSIDGFREERVSSRFDLNFLGVPGAVKDLLDDDRVKARAKGTFFVRETGGGLKKLKFDEDAEVDIRKDR
ncbi:MAG TPA: LEA type 2 family protein [Vicinamibacteria bacterium]|nr:LEA type 2 family protein [Vicinamibacteria bacterium]